MKGPTIYKPLNLQRVASQPNSGMWSARVERGLELPLPRSLIKIEDQVFRILNFVEMPGSQLELLLERI